MSFYTELLNMQKVAKTESLNDFGAPDDTNWGSSPAHSAPATPKIPKMPKIDTGIKLDAPKTKLPSANFDPYGGKSKPKGYEDFADADMAEASKAWDDAAKGSTGMAGVISSVGSSGSRRSLQP